MRAFSKRRAGALPLRSRAASCWRSSPFNLTTYFFTEIFFRAIIAAVANSGDESESQDPCKLVEASD
jgi:hypothetical protein